MKKLFFFAVAGGIGFLVDAGMLLLLLHFTALDPFSARVIAIASAMVSTWMFNRNFTFEKGGRSVASEGLRYGSVGLSSALLNYAIYAAALILIPDLRPIFAVIIASALATGWSYFGYNKFVYGTKKDQLSDNPLEHHEQSSNSSL